MSRRTQPMLDKAEVGEGRMIYHMKAVCGGGKSYAMLKHIREQLDDRFIYAVPTLKLAKEIEEKWHREQTALPLRSITSDNGRGLDEVKSLKTILAEEVGNPFRRQTILITHALLFSTIKIDNSWLTEWLNDWHIVIDENPQIIKEYCVPDELNHNARLSQLIRDGILGKFIPAHLNKKDLESLQEVARSKSRDSAIDPTVRDMCRALAENRNSQLYSKKDPKTEGYLYYAVELLPLANLVDRAKSVTILGSKLSGFTPIYCKHYGIEIAKSTIKPKGAVYPRQLQNRIHVHRVFKNGNISIERINAFKGGPEGIVSAAAEVVGDRFLLRVNKQIEVLLKRRGWDKDARVVYWLPQTTNGLNAFDEETSVIDLAAYNRNAQYGNVYPMLDEFFKLEPGTWQSQLKEINSELSCQALFRTGIRKLNTQEKTIYHLVVPDYATETYLINTYLPHAKYEGHIIDDGKIGRSTGRPKGKASSDTAAKIQLVRELMENFGASQQEACREVGIARATFRKHL